LPGVTTVHPRLSLTISVPEGAVNAPIVIGESAGPLFVAVTATVTVSPTWPLAAVAVTARSAGLAVVNTVYSKVSSPDLISVAVRFFGRWKRCAFDLITLAAEAANAGLEAAGVALMVPPVRATGPGAFGASVTFKAATGGAWGPGTTRRGWDITPPGESRGSQSWELPPPTSAPLETNSRRVTPTSTPTRPRS